MEQGSYLLIEPGMSVRGVDGDLGTVVQVVADAGLDIFRGLVISHGILPAHHLFVAADLVKSVAGRQVDIAVAKDDVYSLPPVSAGSPPSFAA